MRIEEEELIELMTDAQVRKYYNEGKYIFNMPKGKIIEKCKIFFSPF